MSIRNVFAAAMVAGVAAVATAQPVNPIALTGGTQGAYTVVDFYDPLSSAQWFTFTLASNTAVDIDFNRTSAPPDLIATIYAGDITGADATAQGGSHSNVYYQGFGAMTFIEYQDDTEDDAFGGPYGDPRFQLNLGPGTYSIVMTSLQGAGAEYTVTSNLPSPGAMSLMAIGGLTMARRRRR